MEPRTEYRSTRTIEATSRIGSRASVWQAAFGSPKSVSFMRCARNWRRYPQAVAAILQMASNLHRPVDTLTSADLRNLS